MARRRADETALDTRARVQVAFGKRLKAARGAIPQSELAAALGVTRSSVSNIENGRHRVFLDQVFAAADLLKVELTALIPSPGDVSGEPQIHTSGISDDRIPELQSLVDKVRGRKEVSSRSSHAST